jgi:hypothetical protein
LIYVGSGSEEFVEALFKFIEDIKPFKIHHTALLLMIVTNVVSL